jgi:hypothetical protein
LNKFKVGDRVRCYGQNEKGHFDVINEEGDNGTVKRVESGFVEVEMDNDYGEGRRCGFHPKQLRKLVKKKRRRVWLRAETVNAAIATPNGGKFPTDIIRSNNKISFPFGEDGDGFIEFVEVKRHD